MNSIKRRMWDISESKFLIYPDPYKRVFEGMVFYVDTKPVQVYNTLVVEIQEVV